MKMKSKQFVALMLVVLLVASVCGCTQPVGQNTPTPPVTTPDTSQSPQPTVTPSGQEPDDMQARIEAMLPVFDSIMLAKGEREFDFADTELAWDTLYLMGVNFGQQHPLVEVDEETGIMKVPQKTMQEFASACFADYTDLPELPKDFSAVTYDEAQEAFILNPSDRGDGFSEILSYHELDGTTQKTYDVKVGLFGGEHDMYNVYEFTIVDNPNVSGITDPIFYYSVLYAMESYTNIATIKEVYEKDGQTYVVAQYKELISHAADDLDEDGEAYGSDYLEIVDVPDGEHTLLVSDIAKFDMTDLFDINTDLDKKKAGDPTTLEFFEKHFQDQSSDGLPMYFKLNVYQDKLFAAKLWSDYYFAG